MHFLNHPTAPIQSTNTASRQDLINLKFRAIQDYKLYSRDLFRKPYKSHAARYAPRLTEIFIIMANTLSQPFHTGAHRTWETVTKHYYGITEEHCTWMVKHCWTCQSDKGITTKPIIMPILSSGCSERLQINLMDFTTTAGYGHKWVLRMKDHFSCCICSIEDLYQCIGRLGETSEV